MTTFLTNRDGGKTNEEGHIRFQTKVWAGAVATGLQAVQRSPLAMGINITVGDAKVDYSTYSYTVWTDAVEPVAITTADPSNPRIDRIVGYVDRGETPDSANSNNPGLLKFMAIAGTPAGSPSRPSDLTVQAAVGASNPYFDIADVLVGTGVTTISDANITDTRLMVTVGANTVNTDAYQDDSIPTAAYADASVTPDKIDSATYSTTEKVVGTWIDGRTLYRKTINFGALPNSATKTVAHGITNLQDIIKIEGYTNRGTPGTTRPIPYVSTILNNQIQVYVTNTGLIDITTASNLSVYANTFITLTYTKSV